MQGAPSGPVTGSQALAAQIRPRYPNAAPKKKAAAKPRPKKKVGTKRSKT